MPTLDWIGKKAVENHHNEIPFRLLKSVPELSVGDENTGNLIVQGDNLHALKALLPYYAGQVKCICIDPPYNTGNEGWVYNDNVNSPEMKAWLNKVVGREGEDLSRHDKWLCMMYPRLQLLRKFLREDGVIIINIDENELFNIGQLLDEIFGNNRVGVFIWESRSGKGGTVKNTAIQHEYVVVYAKNINKVILKPDIRITSGGNYKDAKGSYKREQLRQWGQGDRREDRPTMYFSIKAPNGEGVFPYRNDGSEGRWRFGEKKIIKMIADNDIDFVIENDKYTLFKKIREGKKSKSAYGTLLYGLGTASTGTKEIKSIFYSKSFDTTKPIALIKHLLDLMTFENKNSLILDSFAGSGTTGHAVMELNKEDGGDRKFILVEMEEKICKEITAERVKRVINGYEYSKANGAIEKVEELGGGFRYCSLDEPLFDELGNINKNVNYRELAGHIFFSETGIPMSEQQEKYFPQIGIYNNTAYYLLFNGILGDKTVNGGNIITKKTLESLPKFDGTKVVFAEGTRINPQKLRKQNIIFKQTHYEIKVS